ncbi:hypothetical protein BJX76DRAFT_353385 [Aspergillus varians]
MDPFDRLPVELIRDVITHTTDFVGVESLVIASSRVRAIFHARLRGIFLDLIAANPITMMPQIQELCRNIDVIHGPSTPGTSLDNYQHTCENIAGLLPEQMTKAELLQILHTAA